MVTRSLIEYSQTPDVNFFLCRRCRTHIALNHELVYIGTGNQIGVFRNLVNVQVDGSAHYHRGADHTGADVYCYTCDSHLGWKITELAYHSGILDLGRFILLLKKLLFWDGSRLLYLDTNE